MPSREERRRRHRRAERAMRRVGKPIKRNRKPRRRQPRNWVPASLDDLEALDDLCLPQSERIMPRGERERRRTVLAEALAASLEERAAEF